jgi:hypothetical protein
MGIHRISIWKLDREPGFCCVNKQDRENEFSELKSWLYLECYRPLYFYSFNRNPKLKNTSWKALLCALFISCILKWMGWVVASQWQSEIFLPNTAISLMNIEQMLPPPPSSYWVTFPTYHCQINDHAVIIVFWFDHAQWLIDISSGIHVYSEVDQYFITI